MKKKAGNPSAAASGPPPSSSAIAASVVDGVPAEDLACMSSQDKVNAANVRIAALERELAETRSLLQTVRGQNEAASVEFSRSVLESSPDCLKLLDAQGRVQYMNSNGQALMEIDDFTAMQGQPWTSLWSAQDAALIEAAIAKALGGEVARFQAKAPTIKGTMKWWDVIVAPMMVTKGAQSAASIISVSRDVTEFRATEKALRESEERYRALFAAVPVAVFVCDRDAVIQQHNPRAEELWGRAPKCGVERHCGSVRLFLPDGAELPHEQSPVVEVLRTGVPALNVEVFIERPDGSRLPVLVNFAALKDVQGVITGAVTSFIDIAERTEVEKALRESEERFRALAENIPQLAWMTDAEGWIFWYNQRWFDYTGTTLEDMQGWGWKAVHHPDYITHVVEKWQRHLAAGEGFEDTFPLRGADGHFRWFLTQAMPIRDAEGKVQRWFGTNTDVTAQREAADALKLAKEEVEAASRAKDEFLAALSHELRTPLTPVLMCASALEGDPTLPMEVREQLAMMRRNIELEARLIDDLLDLTRISRGKLNLAPLVTDVHALLDHTDEIVRSDGLGKQVQIVLKLGAKRHHALVDPTRIQQVFWNLIKNAVKFTPTGGNILVSTANDAEGRIVISVKDNGIGMSAETLPHIFKAFEQSVIAGQHRYGGLGLGLAISQAIITAHDGDIRGESEGLNCGSTFTVVLSTVDTPTGSATDNGPTAEAARKLKLLVVEDHEATRQVLLRLLSVQGHQVTTAGTVQEALALHKAESFDAVISDLGLPDGTGLELMRDLQQLRPIPGIALSGYGMEGDLRLTRAAGFFAHLVKPVNLDQLRQLIDQIPLPNHD